MKKTEKLTELYKRANSLNEEMPAELIQKLSIYGQILEIIGGLWADATLDWKLAEANRKDTIASVYTLDPEGTNKDREMKAEMAAKKWRLKEAQFEGEALRWKAAYSSVIEMINILKKKYEHMQNVAKGEI